jgi:hypothetical protein
MALSMDTTMRAMRYTVEGGGEKIVTLRTDVAVAAARRIIAPDAAGRATGGAVVECEFVDVGEEKGDAENTVAPVAQNLVEEIV